MKKPYQPRNGKYQRTNINITPERKRKAVRIGGSISGGIAKALDEFNGSLDGWTIVDDNGRQYEVSDTPKPIIKWRIAPESEKE